MNKKLVFGLGTGRCGTHSLADLFNSQKNFEVTHELGDNPVLNWAFNDECLEFYLNKITNRQSNHVGDVAFYLLPYVEAIINQFPEDADLLAVLPEYVKNYAKKANCEDQNSTSCYLILRKSI